MDFFIVTPSYNQRRFLPETIESVLSQKGSFTVTYWVFDGGSDDGSRAVLQQFGSKLHWQSKKDKGQTDALNKGILQLHRWLRETGKDPNQVVFAYINSDDYYLPGAFEAVQKEFQHTHRSWLMGDCLIVNENGKTIQSFVRWYKRIMRFWLSGSLLGMVNPIPQPGVFIKASEILKTGFFDEGLRYVMDYDYWLRLFSRNSRPAVISRALAAFRIHTQSKGGSQFVRQFEEQYKVAQRYIKNQVILRIHRLHNKATVGIYRILK